MSTNPTAALLIIGNEILSGRTQDKNIQFLATELSKLGIFTKEVRVIPDEEQTIIETLNTLRATYTYVLTTGGIGPTHDDITSSCVAKAFNTKLVRNQKAYETLLRHYKDETKLTGARLKMTEIPDGASLIDNTVSGAPGFMIENVFVFAGIPSIMQAMFEASKPHLEGFNAITEKELTVYIPESEVAPILSDTQNSYQDCSIGSYPFMKDGHYATAVVVRGACKDHVNQAYEALKHKLDTAAS